MYYRNRNKDLETKIENRDAGLQCQSSERHCASSCEGHNTERDVICANIEAGTSYTYMYGARAYEERVRIVSRNGECAPGYIHRRHR